MKLATYHDGSRDGQLVVVSRDLATAHFATGIATRLQQVMDDWNFLSPQLEDLSTRLNQGRARHAFAFEPSRCRAPLPRAGQWVAGGACPAHLARLTGASPAAEAGQPVQHRAASDHFLGPLEDVVLPASAQGIDFEAGLAVVTGDLPAGVAASSALEGVRLLMLCCEWVLRGDPPLLEAAREPLHARAATSFSPVAVTPDELGDAWQAGRVNLTLQTSWNGRKVGLCEAGPEMAFHFGQLIAAMARHRAVKAGSLVGTGPLSSTDPAKGFHCVAEKRAMDQAEQGAAVTAWPQFGDTVRIEMKGRDGHDVFGAIEQTLSDPPETP